MSARVATVSDVEPPLALYRRYRPESFAEVIGQDHVTSPLRAALNNNRVHHAYLFSGPRGCGKTTSARILARCLNCEQGPTDTPCGTCQSCVDLARGGPGSIDVIEIDAASHGGVDDARDLRERAFFAPVSSRYKIYIIDEAHMVSAAGFNALLKLVEEPPGHIKFVFATTEPEKVIGTIRSRTHHYPFRLIPPRTLSDYLSKVCEQEGVQVDPAALPLVVRSGGGSARDTLSVLDQLIGGAGPDGVTYPLTTGLLGFTPETLLDEVVDAFSAGDGGTVFGVVDKIIETGQDPRRFTEDLLRRLRDLLIIAAVPDAPATGLIDAPEDQADRLVAQSARFGRADLSRAADIIATGLTELKGATAPRLLLELICARVLLPGADHTTQGVMARLDRIEKRMSIEGTPSAALVPAAPSPAPPADERSDQEPDGRASGEPRSEGGAGDQGRSSVVSRPDPVTPPPSPVLHPAHEDSTAEAEPAPSVPVPDDEPVAPVPQGTLSVVDLRRLWPDLIERVKLMRRVTWIHLSQEAHVVSVDDTTMTLGFRSQSARTNFLSGGHEEILRQAAIDVVGHDWRIEVIVDPVAQPGAAAGRPPGVAPAQERPGQDRPGEGRPGEGRPGEEAPTRGSLPEHPKPPAAEQPSASSAPKSELIPPAPKSEPTRRSVDPTAMASARQAIQDTRAKDDRRAAKGPSASDQDADRDDRDADDDLGGAQLLERELGASVIEEIPND